MRSRHVAAPRTKGQVGRGVARWTLSFVMAIKIALLLLIVSLSARAGETPAHEMPELTIEMLSVAPEYPQPQESAQVLLTVDNTAPAPAKDVEVTLLANGEPVVTHTITIAPQSSATLMIPWSAKSEGTYTLSAIVDPRQALTERDRYDNATTLDVVVSAAPAVEADFALTAMQAFTGNDSPGVLRIDVANEGMVSAAAPLVVRRNGKPVTVVLAGPIDPGTSVAIEVPWSDPDRGKLSAEVNPRYADAEPTAKNNRIDAAPAVDGVDLRIEQLAFHTLQYEEKQPRRIGVHFRIVNDGSQDVTQPFRTRIDPGQVNADGKLLPAYVTTAALPAGGTVYVSHIFESAPDEFALTAAVDADDAVAEADESNNAAANGFHHAAPEPDRWVNIGPRRIVNSDALGYGWTSATGRLSTIAIHPRQPSTMYVGAQLGGVWKTTDGGASWISVGESATVRVAALALAPDNPSRVYLLTPNDGMFRSDDDGTSWTRISARNFDAVVHAGGGLLINPAAPSQMLVSSVTGIFRSSDGGGTWRRTLSGGSCTSLVRAPANGTVYAALRHDEDANVAGVYESFDWGATWRLKRGCPSGPLPSDDANTNIRIAASGSRLFVTYQKGGDPVTFRLLRTTSLGCSVGGESDSEFEVAWQPGGDTPELLWSGLWADPGNANILYMTGTYFWRSTNAGSSFSITSGLGASGSAHADHHHIATNPANTATIYSLNDGGIYRSTNRGASGSWTHLGDGITNVEFYDGTAAPTNASLLIGGTQDNGTLRGAPGNAVWSMIKGGDGATVDVDPTTTSIMYAMHQYSDSVSRSTNEGASFSLITNGLLLPESKCFNLHFQVHPGQRTTLLLSCVGLWRTLNSGANWSLFMVAQHETVRTAIDGPADTIYMGTNAGDIHIKVGGSGSNLIYDHPANLLLTDLEINLADPSRLYASFNGPRRGRIVRLVRVSAEEFTARDITSDLPVNLIVRTIAIDKHRPLTLYAGTDRGVYQGRSTDHGVTWFWRLYNNGMPPADVVDLEVHPTSGIMRAFTHGRSAFQVTPSLPTGGQPPLDPKQ